MGFNPYATELVLDFENTRYQGAEVRLRSDISLGELREFFDEAGERKERKLRIDDEWAWMQEHGIFLGWNLEGRDGAPLPLTVAANELPAPLARRIVIEWAKAVLDADVPFDASSGSGGSSPQA